MRAVRTLGRDEARRIYDRIGALQDSQAFYEDFAVAELIRHGRFDAARSVFELGCGTGRVARQLLVEHLPADARYRGVDLSPEMVRLARERLARFGARAEVVLTSGEPPTAEPTGAYDRFVSTYVLDLLAEADIRAVLREAHRMLGPGGLLCVASLGTGAGPGTRALARLWALVHRLRPGLVGGCRPLDLLPFLEPSRWAVRHHARLSAFGVPSEVVVAERRV